MSETTIETDVDVLEFILGHINRAVRGLEATEADLLVASRRCLDDSLDAEERDRAFQMRDMFQAHQQQLVGGREALQVLYADLSKHL